MNIQNQIENDLKKERHILSFKFLSWDRKMICKGRITALLKAKKIIEKERRKER